MQQKHPLEGTVRSRVGARCLQRGRRAGFGSSACKKPSSSGPQRSRLSQSGFPMPSASLPLGTAAGGGSSPRANAALWGTGNAAAEPPPSSLLPPRQDGAENEMGISMKACGLEEE